MPLTPDPKAVLSERQSARRMFSIAYGVVGDRALAYLLDITPAKATSYLEFGNWPDAEPALVELIRDMFKPAETGDEPLSVRLSRMGSAFVRYMPEYETSLCNVIRRAAGGQLADAAHLDPVAAPLRLLGRDVAPLFLLFEATDGGVADEGIEPVYGRRDSLVAARLEDYPVYKLLVAALEADADLNKLLTPKIDLAQLLGSSKAIKNLPMKWLTTTSHAPTVIERGDSIVTSLLDGAYDRVRIRGESGPENLIDEIPPYLDDLRALVNGKKRVVVALTGLAGVALHEGAKQIGTPYGVLRPWRESDRDFIDSSSTASLVLERDVEIRMFVRDKADDKRDPQVRQRVDNQALMAALTLMLGSGGAVTPKIVWQVVQHPFGVDQFVSVDSFYGPTETLDKAELAEIRRVGKLVAKRHNKSIDIAVSRTIRAASERTDEIDQFIDAVIAWENLFGSPSEIAFRISVGMSLLLESDDSKRKVVQREVNALYNLRSKFVHGAAVKPKDMIPNAGSRATELAVAALRMLYLKHHKLLSLEATQRLHALIYGS